jgi:geranylgeranyl reductase family protein
MHTCDVLIVGGGPAGSSCAWALRDSSLDVAILDRREFPRDKVCGGWITPQVFENLAIDPKTYACERVLQPITGFRTSHLGGKEIETRFPSVVSYGILRREFDHYLLRRSGARLLEKQLCSSIERSNGRWIVNGCISTRLLIGAGGHFCPVAKFMGAAATTEAPVVAQESEFELEPGESCAVTGDTPELFFCADMRGYGWCFRKQNRLNVGMGRLDPRRLAWHVEDFWTFLQSSGKLAAHARPGFAGHAYLLYGSSPREIAGDGLLLIGDAAGLAYAHTGEGIGPAIESSLLAAETILNARHDYNRVKLEPYRRRLVERFGKPAPNSSFTPALQARMARMLLGSQWFTRTVVLKRWFLHG